MKQKRDQHNLSQTGKDYVYSNIDMQGKWPEISTFN